MVGGDGVIIQASDLSEIRSAHLGSAENGVVFCSGSFDLLHPGHVWFFESCQLYGKFLVVAVGSDAAIAHRKPGRPIMDEAARLKMVSALHIVDFCYLDTISTPFDILGGISHAFKNLKPNVYAVEDDAFSMNARRNLCQWSGVEMRVIDKSQSEFLSVSTSAIIEKIQAIIK